MNEQLIERLEAAITLLQAYENPRSRAQREEILSVIASLQATLRQIHLPSNFTYTLGIVLPKMSTKADEARLLLATYQKSKAHCRLHMHHELVHMLSELASQLRNLKITIVASVTLLQRDP